MRRFLPLVAIGLGMHMQVNAQTLLNEDFQAEIPNTWTVVDVDKKTVNASDQNFKESGWHRVKAEDENYAAGSTSWYDPAGASDDWLITPSLAIPEGKTTVISWKARAVDPTWADGYRVKVSTSDKEIASFSTELLKVEKETTGTWENRLIDLSAYAGQTIYVAFQHDANDMFLLLIDDVFVGSVDENDVALTTAGLTSSHVGSRAITGTIQNKGSNDITSVDVVINLDGVETTEKLNVALKTGETHDFEISGFDLTLGDHTIGVEVKNLNGSATDVNPTDNVMNGAINSITEDPIPNFKMKDTKGEEHTFHDYLTAGNAVLIDFFASWCAPCQTSTPEVNAMWEAEVDAGKNFKVFGMSVEPTDTDEKINGLGWGAKYNKFAFNGGVQDLFAHYAQKHSLSGIPAFILICPDVADPGKSTVIKSESGWAGAKAYTDKLAECGAYVGKEDLSWTEEPVIYPNPFKNQVTVRLELRDQSDVIVTLMNMAGQVVKSEIVNSGIGKQNITVSTSDLAEGMYTLKIVAGESVHVARLAHVD